MKFRLTDTGVRMAILRGYRRGWEDRDWLDLLERGEAEPGAEPRVPFDPERSGPMLEDEFVRFTELIGQQSQAERKAPALLVDPRGKPLVS